MPTLLPRDATRPRASAPAARARTAQPPATAAPVHAVRTRTLRIGAPRASRRTAAPINDLLEQQAARIAFALHDDVAQDLAVAHLRLAEIQPVLAHAARAAVRDVRALLERMEHRLRTLARELRPVALDNGGLAAGLTQLARTAEARWPIVVTVDVAAGALPAVVETAVYRVVQEALANAGRHARASRVRVRVTQRGGRVRCRVADNGAGLPQPARGRGVGLCAIEYRVAELGGTVRFASPAGGGLSVVVTIPVEDSGGGARAARR
jgi:two-component system sensor histidine kinase UhpB